MDFFHSQESLTTIEWTLRAVIAFFFLVIVARIMGQRAISQLRLLDFVMALVIGNIIAHPLSDEHLGLKGSITTTIVLLVLYLICIYCILKWPAVRKLVNASPILIIKDGEIIYKGLKKARISVDVLLEELRQDKIKDVSKVALAMWEPEGKLSVFLHPKYSPVTPELYKMEIEPFDYPRTIIKEGKIDTQELKQINKEEGWIVQTIEKSYRTDVKNVLLATIDQKDNLKVFLYK